MLAVVAWRMQFERPGHASPAQSAPIAATASGWHVWKLELVDDVTQPKPAPQPGAEICDGSQGTPATAPAFWQVAMPLGPTHERLNPHSCVALQAPPTEVTGV
jgi:hypothetical protein